MDAGRGRHAALGARRRARPMGRGKATVPDSVQGAHAWAYMRRDPDYRAAWAGHAGLPRFETGAFPLRVQTGADLAAADWGLLAWDDPRAAAWRSPFWSGIRMLVGEPDPDPWPDPTPLLPLLAGAGARVEGLRLVSGGSSSRWSWATRYCRFSSRPDGCRSGTEGRHAQTARSPVSLPWPNRVSRSGIARKPTRCGISRK